MSYSDPVPVPNPVAPPTYVPLWCKTHYSFLEGASSPEDLIKTAAGLGLKSLAVTDRNGVYGIVRAWIEAKTAGIHLIIGAQVSLEMNETTPGARGGSGKGEGVLPESGLAVIADPSIILLCQNREGYGNLCTLLTLGHRRNTKGQCMVTPAEVGAFSPGLLLLILPQTPAAIVPDLNRAFSSRIYGLVSRHREPEDSRREEDLRTLARRHSFPLAGTTEILYPTPEGQRLQDVLTCIRLGTTLDQAGTRLKSNDQHALESPAAFASRFDDSPDLVARTWEIAERCTFSLSELVYRYPAEAVPQPHTTASWLRHLVYDGAQSRYQGPPPPPVVTQIERELAIINDLEYAGYFLTMWDIIQFCRVQGILCQGRGSAANSVVCYCLGITAVDPVKMDLLFERFLSQERAEPPDIDLDIEHRRREEVIQYVYRRYGRDRAAMVANVVRYRPKSAIREVGKAFGFSPVTLDRVAKLAPHWGGNLKDILQQADIDTESVLNQEFLARTQEILGFPRHLSIHPGGFLLGNQPVSTLVPIENATMENRTVIQWDKEDIEALGLFKVDLLGLGALTHLDYCFRLIKEHLGQELSMASLPVDDPATYDMLGKADSVGVFQLESRAQMAMLPRLKPRRYYDIVVEISLVRPGPITGGMVHPYLRRREGLEEVEYPHPILEPVLKKTLGVPLFQEQVMKLAVLAADYTPGEADQLRRDMAAWRFTGRIEQHHEKLTSRMIAKGIAPEFANRVFEQIRGFGEYGFPESHAASFGLIAYATAYLKCHYPAIFACGLLNAWPMGFYAPATVLGDAQRHGIRILPMDVTKSQWDCTLEPAAPTSAGVARSASSAPSASSTQPSPPSVQPATMPPPGPRPQPAIRIGMRYLKGLTKSDWDKIEQIRLRDLPSSLSEFRTRCGLRKDTYEKLAQSGALEPYGLGRRATLWAVMEVGAQELKNHEPNGQGPAEVTLLEYEEFIPRLPALQTGELITWDYQSGGHSARGNIMKVFRFHLRRLGLAEAAKVNAQPHGSRVRYVGYAICRQMPGTAGGVMFMTMEDETGFVNLVVWKKVYAEYRTLILTNWLLGVEGTMQSKDGVVHLIPDGFWVPEGLKESKTIQAGSRDFH
ncbi:MAG: DNA polymerase III subunit alpha [Spirochaetales bacterium]|nr:DNA polymerase III subunit alpha [Spirochaetales bacterium]